jgi:dihydrodipicolinate synthase/N-acetylneuraminate lyase
VYKRQVKIQPPFFGNGGKIDQDNLFDYYKRINEQTALPLWAYTMPVANRHPGITASTWQRIVKECKNVYAMKTDAEMMFGYYDLIKAADKKAMVVSGGQMKTMIYGWSLGSRAYLCPIAFFMPQVSLRFTDYMKKGMLDEAIRIIHTFEDRIIGMCTKIDWLALSKAILYIDGFFPTPSTRCPSYTANSSQLNEIRELHRELKQLAINYEQ